MPGEIIHIRPDQVEHNVWTQSSLTFKDADGKITKINAIFNGLTGFISWLKHDSIALKVDIPSGKGTKTQVVFLDRKQVEQALNRTSEGYQGRTFADVKKLTRDFAAEMAKRAPKAFFEVAMSENPMHKKEVATAVGIGSGMPTEAVEHAGEGGTPPNAVAQSDSATVVAVQVLQTAAATATQPLAQTQVTPGGGAGAGAVTLAAATALKPQQTPPPAPSLDLSKLPDTVPPGKWKWPAKVKEELLEAIKGTKGEPNTRDQVMLQRALILCEKRIPKSKLREYLDELQGKSEVDIGGAEGKDNLMKLRQKLNMASSGTGA